MHPTDDEFSTKINWHCWVRKKNWLANTDEVETVSKADHGAFKRHDPTELAFLYDSIIHFY